MLGPLAVTSPTPSASSEVILSSTPGIATPADPIFGFLRGFSVRIGEVSVRPYPSRTVKPNLKRPSSTFSSSLAPPLTKKRIFLPNLLCIEEKKYLERLRPVFFLRQYRRFPIKLTKILKGKGTFFKPSDIFW